MLIEKSTKITAYKKIEHKTARFVIFDPLHRLVPSGWLDYAVGSVVETNPCVYGGRGHGLAKGKGTPYDRTAEQSDNGMYATQG